jgi:L-alanine-DL-glutamate epimerase-like enolase superfamily enzyme
MITRSRRETINFVHPAVIEGLDRELAPGEYELLIEEELIEGLSFASYRRVATLIIVPGASVHHRSTEMMPVTSAAIADAMRIDAAKTGGVSRSASHD